MTEYPKMLMPTPGGKLVEVGVIDREHEIRGQAAFPMSIPLLDHSGIKFTAHCIKEHIDNGRNCNILVTGDPGLGKSTVICQIALEVDPNFSVDNIAFTLKEYEEVFRRNPYGDGAAGIYPQGDMDESAHAMYGPEYQKEEQRVTAKNMIIARIKKQINYFSTPKRKLLNPHVREMVHIWIHVSEPRPYLQGYARVRFAPPERQSEFHVEKYWEPKYAFIFGPLTGPFWEAYEAKKIAFLEDASSLKPKSEVEDIVSTVVRNLRKLGMNQTEIAKVIERNQSTVSRMQSKLNIDTNPTTNNKASA